MSSFNNDESCGCGGGSFGPEPCGPSRPPRTIDILALIEKYNEVITLLQGHIQSDVTDDNPHMVKEWVSTVLQSYVSISALNTALQSKANVSYVDSEVDTLESSLAALSLRITSTDTSLASLATNINDNYVSKANLASQMVITDINNAIAAIESSISNIIADYAALAVKVNTLLANADGVIDFSKFSLTLTADLVPIVTRAGGDTGEIVYVLGMLSESWAYDLPNNIPSSKQKPATVYIKYTNGACFDAVVNIAASTNDVSTKGAISVTASKIANAENPDDKLTNLKVLLITGDDQSGTKRVWLAVRADGWVNEAIDFYSKLNFYVAGINFIPTDRLGSAYPAGSTTIVDSCNISNGFTVNGFATSMLKTPDGKDFIEVVESGGTSTAKIGTGLTFVELGGTVKVDSVSDKEGSSILEVAKDGDKKSIDLGSTDFESFELNTRPYLKGAEGEGHSPFLTSKDVTILDGVGDITFWYDYVEREDGVMVAQNFPDVYLACNGSTFDEHRYPELFARLGTNVTPVIDYAIIKARSCIDITDPAFVASGGSLAQVIATMHGTNVYTSTNDLPFDVAVGTKAIVVTDNMYFVYVRTSTGWEIDND